MDAETGLYYYRARYYSPALGRFLQTDPIGYEDGLNWYAYVGNDPVNGTDPTGEFGFAGALFGAIAGGVGGFVSTGSVTGTLAGAAAGAAVGFVAPQLAASAGASTALAVGAATGATASVAGQLVGQAAENIANDRPLAADLDISPGATAGAATGSGVSALTTRSITKNLSLFGPPAVKVTNQAQTAAAGVEGVITGTAEKQGDTLGSKLDIQDISLTDKEGNLDIRFEERENR